MGTWGNKNFENDSALDWVGDFVENADEEFVAETLSEVIEMNDYLEVDECCYALAAAEIVAAWNNNKSSDFPEEGLEDVLAMKISNLEELRKLSKQAVQRIKSDSELKELWEESGEQAEWYAVIADLEKRLDAKE